MSPMSAWQAVASPYYARVIPAALPTFAEIIASRHIIYSSDDRTIVRIGRHYVAKFGRGVSLMEGENMVFLKSHYRNLKIPEVYAFYKEATTRNKVIIMQYIPARPLRDILPDLSSRERDDITQQIRSIIRKIRSIPAPNFYGAIGERPFANAYWSLNPGPFYSARKIGDTLFDMKLEPGAVNRSVNAGVYRTEFGRMTRDFDYPVFSHGDLHTQNVLVTDDGVVWIIDWETAGFYAAYYEYTITAYQTRRIRERWREMARGFLGRHHAPPTECIDRAYEAYFGRRRN
ncbi:kinase-like domain-containing protein [Xylariaceae sp. FL0662B]|nr:kinase-like domain-containing protein [Xylariaceae sp. FL0662B]